MKLVLTFDDGRIDNYTNAFPILKKHSFTATIYITTGFIDGSFVTDEFGCGMMPLSIEHLKELNKFGIEIASHGDKHTTEVADFETSSAKINKWLPTRTKIGFSVPNSKVSRETKKELIENAKSLKYIREGRNRKCYSFLGKISFVLYKLFKFQFAYNYFNKFNINKSFNKSSVNSVVILSYTKVKSIISFLSSIKDKNCTIVLLLHSITDFPQNKWEWKISKFEELCSSLTELTKNNDIEITTLEKVVDENAKN